MITIRKLREEERDMDIGAYIFVVVISYLLGATPSGYLAGMACGIDVRTAGSGNIGATNVLRVLGRKAGAIVLAADALQRLRFGAWVPAAGAARFPVAGATRENLALAGGVAAILGHIYTSGSSSRAAKASPPRAASCWPGRRPRA
jgi:acyl phosphate:glycerol-3-phosphate acyltransferase